MVEFQALTTAKWGRILVCKDFPIVFYTLVLLQHEPHWTKSKSYPNKSLINNLKICMETQKTPNSQSNLEKEEGNWRNQPTWLQALIIILFLINLFIFIGG